MLQGLRSLEMINVVGAYPTETEELLSALRGLSALRIQGDDFIFTRPYLRSLA